MTAVDSALQRLLDQGRARYDADDSEGRRLWDCVEEATHGGKRFRPALVLLAHRELGGGRPRVAARVGAAVELLHTAFVIHDDVIDGDDVRRGRLNVVGRHRAEALARGASVRGAAELAHAAGILAGDLALGTAIRGIATCGAGPRQVERLLDLVDHALHRTAVGELADVGLSVQGGPGTLETCLAMARQKTGAYSFGLPLAAGAVLADAEDDTLTHLQAAGEELGLAFQLADDLASVFGAARETGKSAAGDLRRGKQTPLIAHAATRPQWPQVRALLGRTLTEEEVEQARALLMDAGSRAYIEQLAEECLARAREILGRTRLRAELVVELVTSSSWHGSRDQGEVPKTG